MDTARHQERLAALGAALPPDLGKGEAARLHTLLEVAFIAAAADGVLAEAEIQNLAANLQAWVQADITPEFLIELFDDLATQLVEQGIPARLAAAAEALDDSSRRIAYTLACVTALVDLEVHDDELGVLGTIADAFGIPSEEAQATFDELDEMVTALAQA